MDASGHGSLDEWADVLVLYGSLVLSHSALLISINLGNILQIALTALIANWAVEWMVSQKELHDTAKIIFKVRKRYLCAYPLAILVFSDLVMIFKSGLT